VWLVTDLKAPTTHLTAWAASCTACLAFSAADSLCGKAGGSGWWDQWAAAGAAMGAQGGGQWRAAGPAPPTQGRVSVCAAAAAHPRRPNGARAEGPAAGYARARRRSAGRVHSEGDLERHGWVLVACLADGRQEIGEKMNGCVTRPEFQSAGRF
jgi:hypothetical protein